MGLGTAATIGLISSGAQAGMSFAQVKAQNDKIAAAQKAADSALEDARKRLDVNYLEESSIAKQAFELEREGQNLAGARATEAGQMSERGAAATAGRVLAAENTAGRDTSARMEQTLVNRENAILKEDGRLRDENVAIDTAIAEGAQQAIADASAARASAMMSGMEGVTSGVTQAFEASDLYKQDFETQRVGATGLNFSDEEVTNFNSLGGDGGYQFDTNLDFNSMTAQDFRKFRRELSDEQWAMMTANQGYISNLNN